MSEIRRLYWLKLHKDFFKSLRIKKLRRLAGGDTFTIIYLKMQLLSLEDEGHLRFTGVEQSFAEELALDLDEDIDNVKVTLQYLLSVDLLRDIGNGEYIMPFVAECIGSEGMSAERMRNSRKNAVAQCSHNVQQSDGEIEIEKDKEIDKEKEYKEKEKMDSDKLNPLSVAFKDYIEMRKKIKKPMTQNAIERAKKKLNEMAKGDVDLAIKILNNSTDNCWVDLYEPKDKSSPPKKPPAKAETFSTERKIDYDALVRGETNG